MSAEIVEGPAGMYVITGNPNTGYDVHRVGPSIASYERKFVARRDIRSGDVEAVDGGAG